jgi:hypothetical protein
MKPITSATSTITSTVSTTSTTPITAVDITSESYLNSSAKNMPLDVHLENKPNDIRSITISKAKKSKKKSDIHIRVKVKDTDIIDNIFNLKYPKQNNYNLKDIDDLLKDQPLRNDTSEIGLKCNTLINMMRDLEDHMDDTTEVKLNGNLYYSVISEDLYNILKECKSLYTDIMPAIEKGYSAKKDQYGVTCHLLRHNFLLLESHLASKISKSFIEEPDSTNFDLHKNDIIKILLRVSNLFKDMSNVLPDLGHKAAKSVINQALSLNAKISSIVVSDNATDSTSVIRNPDHNKKIKTLTEELMKAEKYLSMQDKVWLLPAVVAQT